MQPLTFALPQDIALLVTQEDFAAIAAANRNLRLERTAKGELIATPPTGGESGKRNLSIAGQLDRWCEANDPLGEGFDSSTGFILPNGATRSPDASWVRRDRWDSLTPDQRKQFVPLCPDFVIELRSESDTLSALRDKMGEYMDNGAQLGWLIDPQSQQVEIYRRDRPVETVRSPQSISGEDVLPGFTLHFKRIWR